ncbi:PAS domain-containing protein [Roseivirga sp. BDSF3-8]|uniref:PAS domain-containing protein n=1 Tax=Roseivirga sp. BDSF3-8 TaxID=3241598 RepID=UPI003531CB4A
MIPGKAWKIVILYLIGGVLLLETLRYLLLQVFPFGSPVLLYLCAMVLIVLFLTMAIRYHFSLLSSSPPCTRNTQNNNATSAYAAIYDSDMPFFWISEEGRFTNANLAFCNLFGYSVEELRAVDPNTLHKYNGSDFEELWRLCEKKTKVQLELEGIRKSGDVFPYSLSAFFIEDNHIRLMCGFCQDISERVRHEQAIEENEKRMKLSMEAANEGLWDWDLQKKSIYYDDRCFRMLGFAPNDLLPAKNIWAAIVHPADRFRVLREINGYLDADHLFSIEFRVKSNEDTYKWVNCRGKVVERNPEGRAIRLMGTYVDISLNKKNENAALEAAVHLKIAMEATRQGLWEFDPDTKELYYSDEYYLLLGYQPGGFEPTPEMARKMIHPDDIIQLDSDYHDFINGKSGSYSSTYRVRCHNNTYKWVHSRANFMNTENGTRKMVGIIVDIHNQKVNEMRLKHQNQQLIDYAFFNSHRLRAPLARVMGLAELIKQDVEHPLMPKLLESASELDNVTRDINHILSHDFAAETFNDYTQDQIRNILLVDDDKVSHFLHERIIKSRKADVETLAYDRPREALEHLIEGKVNPDICLLDINMPIIDGFDFLEEMKKSGIDLPVYMLTSSINTEDVRRSKAFKNVRGFITKPLTQETVDKIFNMTEAHTTAGQ